MNKAFNCKIHSITQEENNKLKNVNKTLSHMFCNNTSKGSIESTEKFYSHNTGTKL